MLIYIFSYEIICKYVYNSQVVDSGIFSKTRKTGMTERISCIKEKDYIKNYEFFDEEFCPDIANGSSNEASEHDSRIDSGQSPSEDEAEEICKYTFKD